MAKKWTIIEEKERYEELTKLYVDENKTIGEIAKRLSLGQSTVYDRLLRLNIKTLRSRKIGFNNKRFDIYIPFVYSEIIAEFIGIMLGDGHITKNQIIVTLGNKEEEYVIYISKLIKDIFKITPKTIKTRSGYSVIYFGSVEVVGWLLSMGFFYNKVKNQVNVPRWIFSKKIYVKSFLRGFFDTDGSFYKLKFGKQISFTNRSYPLLNATREGLSMLGYSPSKISKFKVYLTKNADIQNFFLFIKPANKKHVKRYNIL